MISQQQKLSFDTLEQKKSQLASLRNLLSARKQSLQEATLNRDKLLQDSLETTNVNSIDILHSSMPLESTDIPKNHALSDVQFNIYDSPPIDTITYEKHVQTCSFEPINIPNINPPPIIQSDISQLTDNSNQIAELQTPFIKILPEKEASEILSSEEFNLFFSKSVKFIERALDDPFDIFTDYTDSKSTINDHSLKLELKFSDENQTKNRAVSSLDCSSKFPELILGSYRSSSLSINNDDGMVIVWNKYTPSRPEFVFHAQSDVITASFVKYSPHLIAGGTNTGQILLWDMRAKSVPVLKTSFTGLGHAYAIHSIHTVGSENASNLITASDSLVCSWQLDMLNQPIEVIDLHSSQLNKGDYLASTCLGFPEGESSIFWIGTEEGNMYQANRFERAGCKSGIDSSKTYKGHQALITRLDFHPISSSDHKDLVLTSSFDWTVKLWRVKNTTELGSGNSIIYPICSFDEFDEYVHDVCWSPVHPAMFACIDGNSILSIYNLNKSSEMPIFSQKLISDDSTLTKLKWDKSGTKISVGVSNGDILLYDLGEICDMHADDVGIFTKVISNLQSIKRH